MGKGPSEKRKHKAAVQFRKKYSISSETREKQIKTIMQFNFITTRFPRVCLLSRVVNAGRKASFVAAGVKKKKGAAFLGSTLGLPHDRGDVCTRDPIWPLLRSATWRPSCTNIAQSNIHGSTVLTPQTWKQAK